MKDKKISVSKTKIKKQEIDFEKDTIKKALCKKALGFSIDEITEEYSTDEGENLKLVKRKVVSKQIPPDINALKVLFEYEEKDFDVSALSDEDLLLEREKLISIINGEDNNDNGKEG